MTDPLIDRSDLFEACRAAEMKFDGEPDNDATIERYVTNVLREIVHARRTALRYAAKKLRESGEWGTSDAALLLDQMADESEAHRG